MALLQADDKEYSVETRDTSPAHLLTTIDSFSMLSKNQIDTLASEFEAGGYKWKVIINLDDGDEHISVNLSMVGTSSLPAGWEVNAIFNFFLYNHISNNYRCFRGKARRFLAIDPEWGFSKLMSKGSLILDGYIMKDKCVFGAEVWVIKKQHPLIENVCVLKSSDSDPYKREWKISDFSKLGRIWNSEEFFAGGYNWNIMIYPNGDGKARGNYVSIFLNCVDAKSFGDGEKVNADCRFCFRNKLNGDKDQASKLTPSWFNSTFTSWGFCEFIAIGDMLDPFKGFLVDDCCILEIQLSLLATSTTTAPLIK